MSTNYPYQVQVTNRQRRFSVASRPVADLCRQILGHLKSPPCAVAVNLIGDRKMRQMNRAYRDRDYATDVLSFPYPGERVDGVPFLGEIVIAPAVAAEQAARCRASFAAELQRLLTHGLLHLLGYDHETDTGEMRRLESRILRMSWARRLAARPAETGNRV